MVRPRIMPSYVIWTLEFQVLWRSLRRGKIHETSIVCQHRTVWCSVDPPEREALGTGAADSGSHKESISGISVKPCPPGLSNRASWGLLLLWTPQIETLGAGQEALAMHYIIQNSTFSFFGPKDTRLYVVLVLLKRTFQILEETQKRKPNLHVIRALQQHLNMVLHTGLHALWLAPLHTRAPWELTPLVASEEAPGSWGPGRSSPCIPLCL